MGRNRGRRYLNREMPVSKDDEIGRGTRGSVRANGHVTSGGHAVGKANNARSTVRQNNASAYSRANRPRWDVTDGYSGDNMSYQYQEYPKHVYPDPENIKSYVIVNDANEEQQVLGGEEVIDEEDERERLLAVASVKKVPVDKRWGPAKLSKAIETAGFDPTLNPFE